MVEEFAYLLAVADRPVKACVPGPFTLSGRLNLNGFYKDRMEAAWALMPAVNAELKALVAAGADFLYVDEPSFAVYPNGVDGYVELFNATVAGVDAKIGTHLCFGNFRGRPVAKRTYRPLFPKILDNQCRATLARIRQPRDGGGRAAGASSRPRRSSPPGIVDVKNYWCESAADVAARVRLLLAHVRPEKLWLTPDCGLSQTARWATLRKLKALVEGVNDRAAGAGGMSEREDATHDYGLAPGETFEPADEGEEPFDFAQPHVMTALGPIDPGALGFCLHHEHVICKPLDVGADDPDLLLDDPAIAAVELEGFFAAGGRAVVDMTPADYGRDIVEITWVAQHSPAHVVVITGHHKDKHAAPFVGDESIERDRGAQRPRADRGDRRHDRQGGRDQGRHEPERDHPGRGAGAAGGGAGARGRPAPRSRPTPTAARWPWSRSRSCGRRASTRRG